ncbi:acetate--CoA ligase family protein [Melioribacteraceae bacterium 4301-Me]|uniref:acetate--CoA ligase family protein n=1 Tax=Pyranulibacter aquaticus TaxID=3163344 RepID=UPI00359872C6
MDTELINFFYPQSICIVGASTKEKSIGYELLNSIKSYGFTGKIYPVNPNAEEVLGYKCFKKINDIEEKIDLAIIVVPKQFVEDSIDSLLTKKVKSILLITAGFKETGKEGEALESKILQKVKDAGARLVGPNCMGVINTLEGTRLNATFVAEKPECGTTGFLSQSGAIGAAVLNSLRETNIKFAHFISVGNKADVNENDILHFWQNDSNIKILTFYLESFVNGMEFVVPFIKGEITKPTIVLKAGKTVSGMRAASSHTGALSSKDQVVDAVLNQFGIIRVENLSELFNTAKGFENFPIPRGNRVAIITNAGGPAVLAVDSLEKEGLVLSQFSEVTKNKLREIVPNEGSIENPVDMLPAATASVYKSVAEIVLNDENVDALISIFVQPIMVEPFEVTESVYSIKSNKPILQVDMPLPEFWQQYRKLSSKHLPIFKNPEEPAKVIANMLFYQNSKIRLERNRNEYLNILCKKDKNIFSLPSGFLPLNIIQDLCGYYGLPLVKQLIIKPKEITELKNVNYPIVLKGINKNIIHKSEFNAVKLNIKDKSELLIKAKEIEESFNKYNSEVEEFLIQPQINVKYEVLIGGYRDPSFGPIIMFGSGGKYVEIICDTAIKSAFLSGEDLDDMINSTAIGKILMGVRGEPTCNINELKKIIKSSAELIVENKDILEFDINPLIIDLDNNFHAVDIRIKSK